MKKTIAITAAFLLSVSAMSVTAFAAEETTPAVYVTIADADGKLALAQEKIELKDVDGDEKLTVNDALYLAHEAKFNGGAEAGYAVEKGMIQTLWGTTNGGSYGYFVNNKASNAITDEVKDGDFLNAFVYTDTTTWSDSYSWFNDNTKDANAGEEFSLTLSRVYYDSDFKQVTVPVENADILVNGEKSNFKTDAEGKVNLTLDKEGENIISASSDTLKLVPPVCKVNVAAAAETTTTSTETTTETTSTTSAAASSTSASATTKAATTAAGVASAGTGDAGVGVAVAALGVAVATAFVVRRRNNED